VEGRAEVLVKLGPVRGEAGPEVVEHVDRQPAGIGPVVSISGGIAPRSTNFATLGACPGLSAEPVRGQPEVAFQGAVQVTTPAGESGPRAGERPAHLVLGHCPARH
jgi:hypothetical protein